MSKTKLAIFSATTTTPAGTDLTRTASFTHGVSRAA